MTQENKIIIFYSSKDEESLINQWTNVLTESLKESIVQLGSSVPDIKSIQFSKFNSKENLSTIKHILIVIDSKVLSISEEKKHLNNIIDNLPENIKIGVIFTESIKIAELPEKLKKKTAYTFYDIDPETSLERKYEAFGEYSVPKLYWTKILDLAYDLKNEFDLTKSPEKNKIIFLADVTPDQYENRDSIKSELIHRGYKVFPDYLLQGNYKELTEEITQILNSAILSIHIVGSHYGEIIPEFDTSLVEMQCRLSAKQIRINAEKKQGSLQRLVWIQPGIKPSEERQRRFITSLRIEDKDAFSEILQTPLEELKAVLREKLDELNKPEVTDYSKTNLSVYLIHEPKDNERLHEIVQFFEKQEIHPFAIDFTKKTDNMVALHYDFLTQTSSVIICDFNSNQQWIKSKLKDLIKAPGFGRIQPFNVKAIFTKEMTKYLGSDNMLLDANLSMKDALEPFIKKLNQN
jgi:hypothetical protein